MKRRTYLLSGWRGPFVQIGFLLILSTPALGKIIYVDDDANAPGDGKSWTTAYRYLQDALADAGTAEKPVEIRVGQGLYKPDQGAGQKAGDRTAAFQLVDDVSIKGGFGGLGTADPNGRDVRLYETILSGDLAGNDADVNDPCDLLNEPTRAENSYHVLTASRTSETPLVDGFTITGGNANSSREQRGGGLWCRYAKPTVKNCVISRNSAIDYAGGLGGCGRVEDCLVTQNSAQVGGGLFQCGPVCRCVVTHNFAGVRGGGLSSCESTVDCLVSRNSCKGIGGGIESFGAEVIGCTIGANDAAMGGGIANCNMVGACLIVGNQADKGAGVYSCSMLTSCTIASNRAKMLGGGIYQPSHKTTVSNSILWANTAAQGDQVALSGSCAVAFPYGGPMIMYCYYGSISFRYSDLQAGAAGIYTDRDCDEQCGIEWAEGNLDADPCFAGAGYWRADGTPADPNADSFVEGDYHLRSPAGRWDPVQQTWVQDAVTSPCVDAGDPNSPVGCEPLSNGGRINMGAYGGTAEASMSCTKPDSP